MLLSPELKLAHHPGPRHSCPHRRRPDHSNIHSLARAHSRGQGWKGFVRRRWTAPADVIRYLRSEHHHRHNIRQPESCQIMFYVLKYFEYFLLYWITSNIITPERYPALSLRGLDHKYHRDYLRLFPVRPRRACLRPV